jgi:hypothetical protein
MTDFSRHKKFGKQYEKNNAQTLPEKLHRDRPRSRIAPNRHRSPATTQ